MQKKLTQAIQYCINNIDSEEVKFTWNQMSISREPLQSTNYSLYCSILDMMDEFSEEHELDNGWWETITDVEEIFDNIIDSIYDEGI